MGLHGLLRGELYFSYMFIDYVPSSGRKTDE
jgi:hypothetical protein